MFENIKRINEYGNECWCTRELQKVLEYVEWRKFEGVIEKSKNACQLSGNELQNHFVGVDKMVKIGLQTTRKINDYKLSKYACYLIVQNSDSRKKVIALRQTYFDIQTRRQELTERDIVF